MGFQGTGHRSRSPSPDAQPSERSMTSLATPAPATPAPAAPVPTELDHQWELRVEEFEDGYSIRRFE